VFQDVSILIATIGSIFLAFYYIKVRTRSPEYLRKRISDLETLLTETKKDKEHYRQKFVKSQQKIQIETDVEKDPKGAIYEMIDSFRDQIDPRFHKILNNPTAMNWLIDNGLELQKKYPQQFEEFIGKFIMPKISQKGSTSKDGSSSDQVSRL